MNKNKQLCVDIVLTGTKYEEIFNATSGKIKVREAQSGGLNSYEFEVVTKLKNSEAELFTGIANEFINGKIIGVDRILSDGINVSANVTDDEAARIKFDFNRFRVKAEINI